MRPLFFGALLDTLLGAAWAGCSGSNKGVRLRRHHAANAVTSCTGCHGSSETLLAEDDPVPFCDSAYPTYMLANASCNQTVSSNMNENWLYDAVDSGCVVLPPCEDSDGDGYREGF